MWCDNCCWCFCRTLSGDRGQGDTMAEAVLFDCCWGIVVGQQDKPCLLTKVLSPNQLCVFRGRGVCVHACVWVLYIDRWLL